MRERPSWEIAGDDDYQIKKRGKSPRLFRQGKSEAIFIAAITFINNSS
jgi:hypothetical protein